MEINLIDTLSIWKKSGEMNQNEEIKHCEGVNLSQTYKTFLWLWSTMRVCGKITTLNKLRIWFIIECRDILNCSDMIKTLGKNEKGR